MVNFINLEGIQTSVNVPGQFTPILIYKVQPGAVVVFPRETRIIMKLYATDGSELDNKDELYFAFKLPAEKTWTPLTEVFTYQKFKQMSIADQSDVMRTPRIRFSTAATAIVASRNPNAASITFPQDRQIALFVKSNKVFDPTNAENYVELVDVEVLG